MTDINIIKGNIKVPMFNTQQELWFTLSTSERLAVLYLKNEDNGQVTVTIEAGETNDPALLDTPGAVTKVLNQKRIVDRVDIPIPPSAGVGIGKYQYHVRVRATGKISAEFAGLGRVDSYIRRQPELGP